MVDTCCIVKVIGVEILKFLPGRFPTATACRQNSEAYESATKHHMKATHVKLLPRHIVEAILLAGYALGCAACINLPATDPE